MQIRFRKRGNSLGLRIPRALAEDLGVCDGSRVELTLEGSGLRVRPTWKRRLSLGNLLRRITPESRHDSVDTEEPEGREVW